MILPYEVMKGNGYMTAKDISDELRIKDPVGFSLSYVNKEGVILELTDLVSEGMVVSRIKPPKFFGQDADTKEYKLSRKGIESLFGLKLVE